MRYFFILAFILGGLALPAQAQELEKMGGPMQYTTMGAQGRTGGHMNYKALDYDADSKTGEPATPADPSVKTDDQLAADKVWEKYKALAAGQYKEEEAPKPQITDDQSALKSDDPGANTGLASIIDEYRKNKVQRSQMHTIHVAPPQDGTKDDAKKDESQDEDAKKSGD